MTSTYLVKTLGCKANLYDSQLIEAELQKRGWKSYFGHEGEPSPRLCIVNSCTVTDEADRQSRKMASRLARNNPESRVVMTGCGAEVEPERMAQSKGIHYVIGNRNKPELVNLILQKLEEERARLTLSVEGSEQGQILGTAQGYEQMLSRHPQDRDWYLDEGFFTPPVELEGHSGKTRAFLKIQEGCNSFCTYCIIPYGRGPSRSIKPGEVIRQIRELVSQGVREVVITGTNVGDYGSDWAPESSQTSEQLIELFRLILKETELHRLRVSSLDPSEITEDLLSLMASNSRFCAHFHVSLQSPQTRILKLMKRKYGAPIVEHCLNTIQSVVAVEAPRGGAFVGMDVITGFPGETDQDFEESYALLERLPWSRLHVFPYSERGGTPATRLPGSVPQSVRVMRARKLQALSLARLKGIYSQILEQSKNRIDCTFDTVLLERKALRSMAGMASSDTREWVSGYSSNYLRFFIDAAKVPSELLNTEVSVRVRELIVDEAAGEVAFLADLNREKIENS